MQFIPLLVLFALPAAISQSEIFAAQWEVRLEQGAAGTNTPFQNTRLDEYRMRSRPRGKSNLISKLLGSLSEKKRDYVGKISKLGGGA